MHTGVMRQPSRDLEIWSGRAAIVSFGWLLRMTNTHGIGRLLEAVDQALIGHASYYYSITYVFQAA